MYSNERINPNMWLVRAAVLKNSSTLCDQSESCDVKLNEEDLEYISFMTFFFSLAVNTLQNSIILSGAEIFSKQTNKKQSGRRWCERFSQASTTDDGLKAGEQNKANTRASAGSILFSVFTRRSSGEVESPQNNKVQRSETNFQTVEMERVDSSLYTSAWVRKKTRSRFWIFLSRRLFISPWRI